MSLLNQMITTDHGVKPPRIVVYGKPGIGKSTFAAGAAAPLFIDLEGSVDYMDVPKVRATTMQEVNQVVDALLHEHHEYKTLVIDSLDWLEELIHEDICKRLGIKQVNDSKHSDTSYNKGYVIAANDFIDLRMKLDALRDQKNMAIVLTAHTLVKNNNDPVDGDFSEHTIKVHHKFSAACTEWADAVLLLKRTQIESKNSPSGKIDGERVLIADGRLGTVTKNRLYLPDQFPATWDNFINSINTNK